MANSVYNTVCEALSRIVSRRAAENIVREALRGAKTDPNRVTAEQMGSLLKSAVFARLQQIIPVAQAKGEIKAILTQLERSFETKPNPALSPEVLEGLAAIQNEFRPYAKLSQPRAQRLLKSIQDLPRSDDPVKMLNTLWAELDLLQLELSGRSRATVPSPLAGQNMDEMLLSSGEYGINYEFDEIPPSIQKTASLAGSAPEADNVTIPLPSPAVVSAPPVIPAPSTPVLRPSFGVPAPSNARRFDLETPDGRDSMLAHLALEEGVVGVLLTDRRGTVLGERLSNGESDQLAAVVAATTLLLEKRRSFNVFYAHLGEVSAFVGLTGAHLVTVLSDDQVNVGRVLSELASLKEGV
jgi:hypothetical protein